MEDKLLTHPPAPLKLTTAHIFIDAHCKYRFTQTQSELCSWMLKAGDGFNFRARKSLRHGTVPRKVVQSPFFGILLQNIRGLLICNAHEIRFREVSKPKSPRHFAAHLRS